jgi:hypothetical protein
MSSFTSISINSVKKDIKAGKAATYDPPYAAFGMQKSIDFLATNRKMS